MVRHDECVKKNRKFVLMAVTQEKLSYVRHGEKLCQTLKLSVLNRFRYGSIEIGQTGGYYNANMSNLLFYAEKGIKISVMTMMLIRRITKPAVTIAF